MAIRASADFSTRAGPAVFERDRDSDERDRRTLRGKIGEGGRRLRVQTGDGGITLKAR